MEQKQTETVWFLLPLLVGLWRAHPTSEPREKLWQVIASACDMDRGASFLKSTVAALTPQVETTFADITAEVDVLREENAALREQAKFLGSVSLPAVSDLMADTAVREPAATSSDDALQCAEATRRSISLELLRTELGCCEEAAVRSELQLCLDREALAVRCNELGRALEERAHSAEQAAASAATAARQAAAATVAALEEQVVELSEEAARRDALADEYSESAELRQAQERVLELRTTCEVQAAEVRRLRDELAEARRAAEAARACAEARAEAAAEAEAAAAARGAESEAVIVSQQAQLSRLSEGFNNQVEESLAARRQLDASSAEKVDKAVARSWIVNYVETAREHDGARRDLLRLMSEWWEFTDADRLRVGLGDEAPPRVAAPPDASLSDAFTSYLEV